MSIRPFFSNEIIDVSRTRRGFVDHQNFTLKPISFRQNLFPTLPSIPCPPTEFPTERYDRRWRAPSRCVLELVPLMAIAVLEEPPIQMIVQSLVLLADAHDAPLSLAIETALMNRRLISSMA
jgi:hypothetical protein